MNTLLLRIYHSERCLTTAWVVWAIMYVAYVIYAVYFRHVVPFYNIPISGKC